MKYSTLEEKYPNSENPFDFRPPNKLDFRTLNRLNTHIVQGLKIETEQGTETTQTLIDRVYAVVKQMELQSEANPEQEVQALPECIREDVRVLIRDARKQIANLKYIKERGLSEIDDDGSICSW